MRYRRCLVAATLGLLAAAGVFVAPGPTQAQSTSECRATVTSNELRITVCGLLSSADPDRPMTSSTVPLRVTVTNEANRPISGKYSVTGIKATVVGKRAGQILPDPPTSPPPTGSTLNWEFELPANGDYDLEVEAFGDRPSGTQRGQTTALFYLGALPAKPTGVTTSVSPAGKVTITWNANLEPDLVGYEVERSPQGKNAWAAIDESYVESPATSATDQPPVGGWRYRVRAIRMGSTEGRGAVSPESNVATADVDPPPTTTTAANTTSTSATGSDTTAGGSATADAAATGTGTGGTSTTLSRATPVTGGTNNTVDLRKFAAALDAQRRTEAARRVAEPDPGFDPTLPFDVRPRESLEEPEVDGGDLAEPGGDEPELGIGERLVSDDAGERRRSIGFVAGGLLLFVLGMSGLFVKAEVRRADDLDLDPVPPLEPEFALEPQPVSEAVHEPEPVLEPLLVPSGPVGVPASERRAERRRRRPLPVAVAMAVAPIEPPPPLQARLRRAERAAAREALFDDATGEVRRAADLAPPATDVGPTTRRVRRTVAPLDAPALDIPEPVAPTAPRTRTANARRTPPRLPSRPADDRREGDPVVRPRRRGAGQGDRRVPVG